MSIVQKKICVLLSGGLDSALLLQKARDEELRAFPLYVSCGFLWEAEEQKTILKLLEHLGPSQIAPLKVLSYNLQELFPEHWGFHGEKIPDAQSPDEQVHIPGRNLLLLTQAALYAEAQALESIWLSTLKGNPFSDATPEFFSNYAKGLSLSLKRKIEIETTFASLNKGELIQRYPEFPYEYTLSCLQSRHGQHCGACNKCEERRKAFLAAKMRDPSYEG